jgi:hypothetical protein
MYWGPKGGGRWCEGYRCYPCKEASGDATPVANRWWAMTLICLGDPPQDSIAETGVALSVSEIRDRYDMLFGCCMYTWFLRLQHFPDSQAALRAPPLYQYPSSNV